MDLSQFNVKQASGTARPLTVCNPVNDEPLLDEATGEPWTIDLVGSDSEDYAKLRHRLINEKLRVAQRAGRIKATAEALEADNLDLIAGATRGWKHIVDGGKAVEFSTETARDLYERYPWLAEQVLRFVNDRAVFLGN